MPTHPIRFGLQTAPEGGVWPELVKVWKFADDLGYDSMWTSDHYITTLYMENLDTPVFDGWTALAALGAVTKRVRMGVMITGNSYRHPPLLAKMAVTIDHITGGRLIMGIGAGWYEREHQMFGIPFPPPGERVHRMGEAIQIFDKLWREKRVTFNGKYYQLKDAICDPKPVQKPRIPIWVGGWGEQLTLKYCAMYGDGWNLTGSPINLVPKVEALKRHCDAVGRNMDEIEKSVMHMRLIMTDDQAYVKEYVTSRRYKRADSYEDMHGHFMIGTPDDMKRTIEKLLKLGFTHFVAEVVQPYDYCAIERWYKEVATEFKGR